MMKEDGESSIGDNLENWMSQLPQLLRETPIIYLAIPGSHDSGSYSIARYSDVSPDAPPGVYQLASMFGSLVKRIVYNWSVTQCVSITEQLMNGVRYLDLRLGARAEAKSIFIVHGQYGMEIQDIFTQVRAFLDSHKDEVIVMDFQHFHSFNLLCHNQLIDLICSYFGTSLCPLSDPITEVTLNWMRDRYYQIIAIYRNDTSRHVPNLWPSESWPTPWPDTTDVNTLLTFLESELENRPLESGFVTQCILTPNRPFLLRNIASSLQKKCAAPCNHAIIPWLQKQMAGPGGVNVVIADYILMFDVPFCQTVIKLNETILQEERKQI